MALAALVDGLRAAGSIGSAFVVSKGGRTMKQRINALFAGGLLALALLAVATAGRSEEACPFLPRLCDGLDAYRNRDYVVAMRLWRSMADEGDATAQGYLGMMYANGRGVPQDDVQALMWFSLAASSSSADAKTLDHVVKSRDFMRAKMTPDQIAKAQRMVRDWVPK
jgi:TPR repeat protein